MYAYIVRDMRLSMTIKVVQIVMGNFSIVKSSGRSSLFAKVSSTIVDDVRWVQQVSRVSRNTGAKGIKVSFPFSMKRNVFISGQVPPKLGVFISLASTTRAQAEGRWFVHIDPDLKAS
jgi:hypothetical protein